MIKNRVLEMYIMKNNELNIKLDFCVREVNKKTEEYFKDDKLKQQLREIDYIDFLINYTTYVDKNDECYNVKYEIILMGSELSAFCKSILTVTKYLKDLGYDLVEVYFDDDYKILNINELI